MVPLHGASSDDGALRDGSYNVQLSFDGGRIVTPWLGLKGHRAPKNPVIHVELVRSGGTLTQVKARVIEHHAQNRHEFGIHESEKVMGKVPNQSRTAGLHYFFPANINKLVEVIRQKKTSDETFAALMTFADKNRKVAISVNDFPGFAINPVFISSYMVLNSMYSDACNAATLDHVSKLALGVRYGIMWVLNGSGLGTAYHAAESMHEYLAHTDVGFPAVPEQLKTQFESGKSWDIEAVVSDDEALLKAAKERLLGSVFAISTHLIEKNVVSIKDLELGITTALAWPKGPFTLMNEMGMAEVTRLIHLTVDNGTFKIPKTFATGIPSLWKI